MILYGTEATGPLRDVIMVFAWAINLMIVEVSILEILSKKGHQRRVSRTKNRSE
jgi:hypothetical protein